MNRFGAVESGSDGDAGLVEHEGEVVVMYAIDGEGDEGGVSIRVRGEDAESVYLLEFFVGLFKEGLFVEEYGGYVEALIEIKGFCEGYGLNEGRCTGFESLGEGGVGAGLEGDGVYHFASAEDRRPLFHDFGFCPENSDAGGPVDLVPGEGV